MNSYQQFTLLKTYLIVYSTNTREASSAPWFLHFNARSPKHAYHLGVAALRRLGHNPNHFTLEVKEAPK